MSSVDHPKHYNQVPGIECIDVVEHFNFNRGNAIKYIWRAGDKGNEIEDLQKALWYIQREIERVTKEQLEEFSPLPEGEWQCAECEGVGKHKQSCSYGLD